jgi:hypothetical protein
MEKVLILETVYIASKTIALVCSLLAVQNKKISLAPPKKRSITATTSTNLKTSANISQSQNAIKSIFG